MIGTIKNYGSEKGYGFIKTDEDDYFFHATDIGKIIVEFTPKETHRGKIATNVKITKTTKNELVEL